MRAFAVTLLTACAPVSAETPAIISATYTEPTTRYAHGVLGDAVEWGALEMRLADGRTARAVLPEDRVFEDLAPRLVDLDADGAPEVIVVESHLQLGARLAVYGADGLITANNWIGRSHRWLAPAGVGDIDGDGLIEIGYVDRPHLAKELRGYRFRDGALEFVASTGLVTNHLIGDDFITGGARECAGDVAFVLASGNWRDVVSVGWTDGGLSVTVESPSQGPRSFEAALSCK